MSGVSLSSLRERVVLLLSRFGSGKVFNLSWVLNVVGDQSRQAYDGVRHSSPRSQRHDLSVSYQVQSIKSLDALRPLTVEGAALSTLAHFRMGDDQGQFLIETETDGHRVRIRMTNAIPTGVIERIVGLDFTKE